MNKKKGTEEVRNKIQAIIAILDTTVNAQQWNALVTLLTPPDTRTKIKRNPDGSFGGYLK